MIVFIFFSGILKYYEGVLTQQQCTATTAQFLIRLPEDLISDELFKVISTVHTSVAKKSFSTIFQSHVGNLTLTSGIVALGSCQSVQSTS